MTNKKCKNTTKTAQKNKKNKNIQFRMKILKLGFWYRCQVFFSAQKSAKIIENVMFIIIWILAIVVRFFFQLKKVQNS